MIQALTPGTVRDYICMAERGLPEGESPTVWKLRTLTARQQAELEDAVSSFGADGSINIRRGAVTLIALKYGLAGAENFGAPFMADAEGRPKDEFIDRIPAGVRKELADAVTEYGRLTEGQEKN